MSLLTFKETYVWLALVIVTGASFLLGETLHSASPDGKSLSSIGLLALAFFKVRLVIFYFMEVRKAPLPLRTICDAWLIATCLAVMAEYWFSVTRHMTI